MQSLLINIEELFMKKALLLIALLAVGTAYALDIVMDAQKDDFYNTLTGPDDGWVYIGIEAADPAMTMLPDDEYDLSANCWLAWDTDYLYCYAEVWDEIVQINNPTTYENDAIEFKMDPDPLMETTAGIAAIRLSALGEDLAEVPDGVDNLVKGGELDEAWEPVEGEDYARVETNLGYNLEFRLPFDKIVRSGKYVNNTVNGIMGLAINIMDNDNVGRDTVERWCAFMSDNVWNNPQYLGTITLLEENKIKMEPINSAGGTDDNTDPEWYIPTPVAVGEKIDAAPISFALVQNYPNPFNPATTISYSLSTPGHVLLTVYSMDGREIATLVDEPHAAGDFTVTFDAIQLSSGVYLYQLQTGDQKLTRKMTLLR